jgi:hypothetical protein
MSCPLKQNKTLKNVPWIRHRNPITTFVVAHSRRSEPSNNNSDVRHRDEKDVNSIVTYSDGWVGHNPIGRYIWYSQLQFGIGHCIAMCFVSSLDTYLPTYLPTYLSTYLPTDLLPTLVVKGVVYQKQIWHLVFGILECIIFVMLL